MPPLPKETATLLQKNSSLILGLYALADIGIHFEGWALTDTVAFFQSYGIAHDVATIRDIYELIVADPANYLKYYIGYAEFLDHERDAVNLWGEAFSQKRFHQEILELGPASFDLCSRIIYSMHRQQGNACRRRLTGASWYLRFSAYQHR